MDAIRVSTITHGDGRVIVTCVGDLDLEAGAEFERVLAAVTAQPPVHLELDLSGVTFFGISALSLIVRCTDRLSEAGCTVTLLGSNRVRRVLELAGVADRFLPARKRR